MDDRRKPAGWREWVREPWVIAAGALLLIIVVLVLVMGFMGREDQDKLGDDVTTNAVSGDPSDPEQRCAETGTYERIKRQLFAQAASMRGRDQEIFARLAGYAVLRGEAPILRGESSAERTVDCSAYLTLDLPPGVEAGGGRRSLAAEVGYTIRAGGGAERVTVTAAEAIVVPLSQLARVGAPTGTELGDDSSVLVRPPADALPRDDAMPSPTVPPAPAPAPVDDPEPAPPQASARPSFNCANAATRGELAVCNDTGLAALDRNMAAEFRRALAAADPAQRALLLRTRDSFLGFRDRCGSRGCMADAYLGRIREIRDIMAGRWRPN